MRIIPLRGSGPLVALVGLSWALASACDTEPSSLTPREEVRPAPASDEPVLHLEADGTYTYDPGDRSFAAVIYPTGEVAFRDWNEGGFSDLGIKVSGPAEWSERSSAKQRHARKKALFLRQTAKRRAELATEYRGKQGDAALAQLGPQLEALNVELYEKPEELRRRVFALWDECVEGDPESAANEAEAARLRQGQAARAEIIEFVRRRLPEGAERAYTAAELAKLNEGRASKAMFEPYVAH